MSGVGNLTTISTQQTSEQFTDPQKYNQWPQAHLHTQWPGTGEKGDPVFDAFYAAQVQYQSNMVSSCTMMSSM